MEHAFYQVLHFEQLGTYTLRLTFDDGTAQVIDFEPVLRGEVWPNDADFDPADLHDWPEVREAFIRSRAHWRD